MPRANSNRRAMEIAFVLSVVAIVLWLNIKATLAVRRDAYSVRAQKFLQLLFIWTVPIAGSVVVLAIHCPDEKHSGKYREEMHPPDDYVSSGRTTKGIPEAMDGD